MVELILAGAEASFDVAETLSVSQLAKGHTEELIPAREGFDLIASVIAIDVSAKMLGVDEIHQLGERVFFGKHSERLAEQLLEKKRAFDSDRSHPQTATGSPTTLTPIKQRVLHTRMVV
jgi:hypothetical protein